jgi:hypothetical protein
MKKRVGSGVGSGSGSISKRCESGNPDPHQKCLESSTQHCLKVYLLIYNFKILKLERRPHIKLIYFEHW